MQLSDLAEKLEEREATKDGMEVEEKKRRRKDRVRERKRNMRTATEEEREANRRMEWDLAWERGTKKMVGDFRREELRKMEAKIQEMVRKRNEEKDKEKRRLGW